MFVRNTIAAALILSSGILGGSRVRADDELASWVGESVLPVKKDFHVDGQIRGKLAFGPFTFEMKFFPSTASRIPIKVLADSAGKLRIFDGQTECTVQKADFVLVSAAPARFERLLEAKPKDVWLLHLRGNAYFLIGKPDEAIRDFDQCIELNPKDPVVFNSRGNAWCGKQAFDKAITDYDEAIRLEPKYPFAFNGRGNAWFGKGDQERACHDLDEAIRLAPNYALAYFNRANVFYSTKSWDKALEDYDNAVRLDPTLAMAFNNRGNTWKEKKDIERAMKDYDEAIRLDSRLAVAYHNKGVALFDKRDYQNALLECHEATRLDPNLALAFFFKARCYAMQRNNDRAIDNLRQALERGLAIELMTADNVLDSIRNDPNYQKLLQDARSHTLASALPALMPPPLPSDADRLSAAEESSAPPALQTAPERANSNLESRPARMRFPLLFRRGGIVARRR